MRQPKRLSWQHKKTLAPFSTAYDQLVDIQRLSDRELNELARAIDAVSTSNCSWSDYRAAQILKPEVLAEGGRRSVDRRVKIEVTA